jgi:ABC-type Fe3+/spermidine/putrescine transport system ATPase subunit
MPGTAKAVRFEGVAKHFGKTVAVHSTNLTVAAGEFLTLLGPSGCGKTTLLRMTAGLEGVTGGHIFVGGVEVTNVPPNRRDTSIMFQDYALFPHKTLLDNIGYGLKMRGVPKPDRDRAATEWLKRIELPEHGRHYPHELSGGQRQRVALARSLIINPGVLLLDEPLGALDANLRRQLQGELKRIHCEVGLTFIYVTHDQEEALTMSDRIAVMREGHVEQLGTPGELYDQPATEFVARFLGVPNIIRARITAMTAGVAEAESAEFGRLHFCAGKKTMGAEVSLALRPSRVTVGTNTTKGPNTAKVKVTDVSFAGDRFRLMTRTKAGGILAIEHARHEGVLASVREGDEITAQWSPEALVVLS